MDSEQRNWKRELKMHSIKFLSINYLTPSKFYLNVIDAELNSDNDDACIQFFNMILDDEYLPSEEDIQLLTSRIFYIVRHDSIDVELRKYFKCFEKQNTFLKLYRLLQFTFHL